MTFITTFQSRGFETALPCRLEAQPTRLAWSCFGGPSDCTIRMNGQAQKLIETTSLLRAPVNITDSMGSDVWWGFVNQIIIYLEGAIFTISLDELFNKVKVIYSFMATDTNIGSKTETSYMHNNASQEEYGVKEKVLYLENVNQDFAENFRDIFLETHAWAKSQLDVRYPPGEVYAELYCLGWFKTFQWATYQSLDGFYANLGPGPGTFQFGKWPYRCPGQKFTPANTVYAKYAYFFLGKNASPTTNNQAIIYNDNAGVPGTTAGSSAWAPVSGYPASSFAWEQFTFTNAVTLTGGNSYWLHCYDGATHASNNFRIRTDENNNYNQDNHPAMYWNASTSAWTNIPNITAPAYACNLYFRLVCRLDTGTQINNISTAGDQFFNHVAAISTGLLTCPYIFKPRPCDELLRELMVLGTTNNRMVLAKVSTERILTFYEGPGKTPPTAYLRKDGLFYTDKGTKIVPYQPPVGQYAILLDSQRLVMPFDVERVPTTFIANAVYYPAMDRLLINA